MRKIHNYKGVKVNSFGIPIFDKQEKTNIKGKIRRNYNFFKSKFTDDAVKDLIIMYDVPSEKKKERDWFRRHLKKFGYIMIQKSVWVGPSPLPDEFLKYVESIGLRDKLKSLKLAKGYSEKDIAM